MGSCKKRKHPSSMPSSSRTDSSKRKSHKRIKTEPRKSSDVQNTLSQRHFMRARRLFRPSSERGDVAGRRQTRSSGSLASSVQESVRLSTPQKNGERRSGYVKEEPNESKEYSPIKTRALIKKEVKETDRCRLCKSDADGFISCVQCQAKYHLECLGYPSDSARLVRQKRQENWLCANCISCAACGGYIFDPENVQCFSCDLAYHGQCQPQTVKLLQSDNIYSGWFCEDCAASCGRVKNEPSTSETPPKTQEEPNNGKSGKEYRRRKSQTSALAQSIKYEIQLQRDELNNFLKDECRTRLKEDELRESKARKANAENLTPKKKTSAKCRKRIYDDDSFGESPTNAVEVVDGIKTETSEAQRLRREAERNANIERIALTMQHISSPLDYELYMEAKREWAAIENSREELADSEESPQWVYFGSDKRWAALYPSPYPRAIANSPQLYICRFCLTAVEDSVKYAIHQNCCKWKHPPGNEIYRKDGLSFWELDGDIEKGYCRRLCLLSKLFLSSKTLHHEVETFLFYLLTENISEGCVLLGYFSKEKYPSKNNNLSCLLTLPSSQRTGYGRFLIDLSYKLSLRERKIGGPEHPLSDLGLLSYRSYWKAVIISYLRKRRFHNLLSIKELSFETAIHPTDIVSTLLLNRMLKYRDGNYYINAKKAYSAALHSFRRKVVHDDSLVWEPEFEVEKDPQKMGTYID